ncbi:hypothetical protein cand_001700 [Cryptosporidium andersoni]|uniref:Uncharacterized protein n=1 Tax=Cryptosporidium andersoni TaxID=117008 RepID=A0A1J4MQZ8_9CRYT|nr:hypothetical protein cand_001700 [Cryptosporidium andersoni]
MLDLLLAIFIKLTSFLQVESYIVCNACTFQPIAAEINTHYLGALVHYLDFEFQLPCNFYNPIITVSAPNNFLINSLTLLPTQNVGIFDDFSTECEMQKSIGYSDKSNLDDGNEYTSNFTDKLIKRNYPNCSLSAGAETEFSSILTSLGFLSWQIHSQDTQECILIPSYKILDGDAIKLNDDLPNGTYILRFNLTNPYYISEYGFWNLSITSTQNNMPTIPYCITSMTHEDVVKVVGPWISNLEVDSFTANSYFSGSHNAEINIGVHTPYEKLQLLLPDSSNASNIQSSKYSLQLKLTFPPCQMLSCFNISQEFEHNFCIIEDIEISKCSIERRDPQLVLLIELDSKSILQSQNIKNNSSLNIKIENLVLPMSISSERDSFLDIGFYIRTAPTPQPSFINFNSSIISNVTLANSCLGEWLQYVVESDDFIKHDLYYTPISVTKYTLPSLQHIELSVKYRTTTSKFFPVLINVPQVTISNTDSYSLCLTPPQSVSFDPNIIPDYAIYSPELLSEIRFQYSKLQPYIEVSYEKSLNCILIKNITSSNPLQCVLVASRTENNSMIFNKYGEYFYPLYNSLGNWNIKFYKGYKSSIIYSKDVLGEIYNPYETNITEISGPVILKNQNSQYYNLLVYLLLSEVQRSKAIAVKLSLPFDSINLISDQCEAKLFSPKGDNQNLINITTSCEDNSIILNINSKSNIEKGWWTICTNISQPVPSIMQTTSFVHISIASSASLIDSPYLTSTLILDLRRTYLGPYIWPVPVILKDNTNIYENIKYQSIDIVVQQQGSSYHPFPLLPKQNIYISSNSPYSTFLALSGKPKFLLLYIVDQYSISLDKKSRNFVFPKIFPNTDISYDCSILFLGNTKYKYPSFRPCKRSLEYINSDNMSAIDIASNMKVMVMNLQKQLKYYQNYKMTIVSIISSVENSENIDLQITSSNLIKPRNNIVYYMILKSNTNLPPGTLKLKLDPFPWFFDTGYELENLLAKRHIENLYMVPQSLKILRSCFSEQPKFSKDDSSKLVNLKTNLSYLDGPINTIEKNIIPSIPGSCNRKLLESSSRSLFNLNSFLIISLVLITSIV